MNAYVFGVAIVGTVAVAAIYFLTRKRESRAISPELYKPFRLIDKESVSPNTYRFRFSLPSKDMSLGLPTGRHILLKFDDVSRPYTPISSDEDKGFFELVVKVYPGGKMSKHLEAMKIGETIDVKGPLGAIQYHGMGDFSIKQKNKETKKNEIVSRKVSRLGLIAGGTGITPMLQVIRAVLKNPRDKTQLSLIFANVTEPDILLRSELERCAMEHKSQFSLFFTLDKPTEGWNGGAGFVTADMIQKHLPGPAKDMMILMCGPPPMMTFMQKNMTTLNYPEENYFIY